MLTLKVIRENRDEVLDRLARKNFDGNVIVDEIIAQDDLRRSSQTSLDAVLNEVNTLSRSIGALMKEGRKEEANDARAEVNRLKESSRELEESFVLLRKRLKACWLPSQTCLMSPYRKVKERTTTWWNRVGENASLPEGAMPHWELAKKYDLIDFELGVKIAGAGFPVYKGAGARLQRSLINFFLDCARCGLPGGATPYVVNSDSGFGTGSCPTRRVRCITWLDDLYLIPTAERSGYKHLS